MRPTDTACRDALGGARGDARDAAELVQHVQACDSCRHGLAEVRAVAHLVREALDAEDRAALVARAVAARLAHDRGRGVRRTPAYAWALAAAAGFVGMSLYLADPGTQAPGPALGAAGPRPAIDLRPTGQQPAGRFVFEVQPASDGRLPYVMRGPRGEDHGTLPMDTQYVLETVPADAVVIDTF